MSPEYWQRIDRLFDEALDLPPDERMAFLDGACDGDEALREEVEALLAACENATGFLDQPPISLAETALSPFFEMPENDLAPGQTLGRYRIVEPIGRGGMGAVYLAERDDGHFHKRVALKVVKRGMDTDEIVGRFRYERQILARLEHEGIARLLDGGITQDGRPYFVMECVDGEPLDEYCDRMRLSVRERLALFMDVLEAVRYAHHNLVVHRDLKPSNILVAPPDEEGGRPQVKLLDFGIAKLLDTDAATTIPLTEAHTRRLTPDYAAPEQIRGEPPTPATDVYALGIILYELLTGRRPYHFPTRQLSEIEQTICERAPHKPSTAIFHARLAPPSADDTPPTALALAVQRRTLPKKLYRILAGDLDAIILKALRKEPERRYASAAELLSDLCRYTEGKTVRARPDTFHYRTSRFVRQHKVGVAATALIILTLVGGIVATTWQALEARRGFREAQMQTERAESVQEFLANVFAQANPDDPLALAIDQDDSTTARELFRKLIDNGRTRIGELGNPLDQAAVLDVLGGAYTSRGYFAEAESTFAHALALKRGQLGDQHPDLAASLFGMATAVQNYPDLDRAIDLHQQAIHLLDDAPDEERQLLPSVYIHLGWVYLNKWKYKDAEAWYVRALDEIAGMKEQAANDSEMQLLKAEGLNGLGIALGSLDRFEEAERALRHALSIQKEILGPAHPRVANTMYSLAGYLVETGNLHAAEDAYRRALVINRRVYGIRHVAVANVLQDLADLKDQLRQPGEAEALHLQALDIYDRTPELWRRGKAFCLLKLGRLLLRQRIDIERAADYLQQGLSLLEQEGFVENDPTIVQGRQWLAEAEALAQSTYSRSDEER